MEAEPNDVGTPNVLNTSRCGTLPPGDVDYLQINRQTAFQLSWSGFVNVQLIQNAPGGPYLLKITSQNPSTTTSWQISFTN
jgi:hypothetical protein